MGLSSIRLCSTLHLQSPPREFPKSRHFVFLNGSGFLSAEKQWNLIPLASIFVNLLCQIGILLMRPLGGMQTMQIETEKIMDSSGVGKRGQCYYFLLFIYQSAISDLRLSGSRIDVM